MLKNKAILFCFVVLAMVLSLACYKPSWANFEQGNFEKNEHTSNTQKVESIVARIVFVGQKQACDCTRNRIESTWNVLSDVLKKKPGLPVKHIQRDVDKEETEKMAKLKPLMVAPGIYCIDKQEGLVELLQGEVSKEQIERVIK